MVHAKTYETMSTFVKVMQKKTLASFFSGHGVVLVKTLFLFINWDLALSLRTK